LIRILDLTMTTSIVPKKILLVDDDLASSKMFADRLRKRGYDVLTQDSGNDILEFIEKHAIEMVLLDIEMPGLSGIEVLKIIRAKFEKLAMPVIMVTARDTPDDLVNALELGANDYLPKPIAINIALARIDTQIKIRDLYVENIKNQRKNAINALVIAFNHEINNPLTVALGYMAIGIAKNDMTAFKKSEEALFRIAEVVKKITELTRAKDIETTMYSEQSQMLKI